MDAELETLEPAEERDDEDTLEHILRAPAGVNSVRLDQYLTAAFPGYSRSLIQRAITSGSVRVNDAPAKASYKVRPLDVIRLAPLEPPHPLPVPENIPLDILYEDDYLAVINKPANMVVHPAKGNWSGTLVNGLRFHFQRLSGVNGDYRPGIVHRLDRDTTGAILVAKEENAHRSLSMQFETRKVFKEYHCLVQGVLDRDSDYVEKAIGPHPHDREKKGVYPRPDEERGIREACTYYEVIERFPGYTYVRCHPKTGRTHQIRVHLLAVGCPIVADELYSGRKELRLSHLEKQADPDEVLLSRQALHAHRLRFIHPATGRWLEVVAPLPEDFQRALNALRGLKT
jgi:23S rRNA pseudouridine1911/1915/1917 synthase